MRVLVCALHLRDRAPPAHDVAILQEAHRALAEAVEQLRQRARIAPEARRGSAQLGEQPDVTGPTDFDRYVALRPRAAP